MRIIIYLISISLALLNICSCSKGDPVSDPGFGNLSIANFASGETRIIQGTDHEFIANGKNFSLLSGKNRFRFYNADLLLLDTLLSVDAFEAHAYFMFRPAISSPLKIVDSRLNDFDKELKPDSGSVKISLANFSKSLPDRVNIYVLTSTYIPYALQPVQVGAWQNVSRSFSGFQKIKTGRDQSSRPVKEFTLVVKDPDDRAVLSTATFTLPLIPEPGKQASSVYLIYINGDGQVIPLMSK